MYLKKLCRDYFIETPYLDRFIREINAKFLQADSRHGILREDNNNCPNCGKFYNLQKCASCGGDGTRQYDPFPKGQMNGKEIAKFLEKQGFERQKGGDGKYRNPVTGGYVAVHVHGGKDIPTGTLAKIRKKYNDAIRR